ncbi:hypothetical protein F3Y22_tig00112959pilonHSYRG00027 [Hibiscus syriacus]|uniref:Endonuclease/exonuclease/phosphatase domain-containing protein n=1 Tax=Hibiscus syriacus TaxID=106335 RepID=A0A6A2XN87_HIBSY|nr:hypothetical protein F3Y22_tig00112959pilonHSYRG00027 [Hibiscus syriacus]
MMEADTHTATVDIPTKEERAEYVKEVSPREVTMGKSVRTKKDAIRNKNARTAETDENMNKQMSRDTNGRNLKGPALKNKARNVMAMKGNITKGMKTKAKDGSKLSKILLADSVNTLSNDLNKVSSSVLPEASKNPQNMAEQVHWRENDSFEVDRDTTRLANGRYFSVCSFMVRTIFWNTQGVLCLIFNRYFKMLLKNQKPDIMVILEPRVSGAQADKFIRKSGFNSSFRVEAHGFSRGDFFITFVYASPDSRKRSQVWEQVEALAPDSNTSWVLGGDFNAICSMKEMKGGSGRRHFVLSSASFYFDLEDWLGSPTNNAYNECEESTRIVVLSVCKRDVVIGTKKFLDTLAEVEDDRWCDDPDELQSHAVRFFLKLFTSEVRWICSNEFMGGFQQMGEESLKPLTRDVSLEENGEVSEAFTPTRGIRQGTKSLALVKWETIKLSVKEGGLGSEVQGYGKVRHCPFAASIWRALIQSDKQREFMNTPIQECSILLDSSYVEQSDFLAKRFSFKESIVSTLIENLGRSDMDKAIDRWRRPAPNWIKANADRAMRGALGMAAVGGVLLDHHGNWIRGFSRSIGICNVEVESVCKKAVSSIRDGSMIEPDRETRNPVKFGLGRVSEIFSGQVRVRGKDRKSKTRPEPDPLPFLSSINHRSCDRDGCTIVKLIKDMLAREWEVKVNYYHRGTNMVVDKLEAMARGRTVGMVIYDEPPIEVVDLVRREGLPTS